MRTILLGNCLGFSCLADKCPSNCCKGWQIAVDDVSYKRFLTVSDSALREDILSNIIKGNSGYHFANRKDGSCKMLDGDGLCRIWKKSSEEMLCETCRKYPKLLADMEDGSAWISMAASCPIIAEGICVGKVTFYACNSGNSFKRISFGELKNIYGYDLADIDDFLSGCCGKQNFSDRTHPDWFRLYKGMLLLVDKCMDLMVEFRGSPYLDECFAYFEDEAPLGRVMADLSKYRSEVQNVWLGKFYLSEDISSDKKDNQNGLAANYWVYRQFTRYLENRHEIGGERDIQVAGELLLIYTVGFSRYMSGKGCNAKTWREQVAWAYRFCAHGFKMAQKLHGFFVECGREVSDGFCVAMSDSYIG